MHNLELSPKQLHELLHSLNKEAFRVESLINKDKNIKKPIFEDRLFVINSIIHKAEGLL